MLSRLRSYLSRVLAPQLYATEEFRLINLQYLGPQDISDLPATQKRTTTVCTLFANQHKSIDEITKLLDTNRGTVISALIEEGIILDRRLSQRNDE